MKVTILGTANAWGPNPFLTPPAPWPMTGTLSCGESIEIRKYRTSLLVESSDGKTILVDCGPDFSHQIRDYAIGVPDAIFITHPHFDHIGGLDDLNLCRPVKGRVPIPTYATKACWDTIKGDRGLGYVVTPLNLVSPIHLVRGQTIKIGSVAVAPLPVEHDWRIAPGAVGLVFEETASGHARRVLYTGDLWAFSNPSDPLLKKPADVAIIECDRFDGLAGPSVGGGHMSFQEAVRMLASGPLADPRPRQVVFVHFGDNGPNGSASTYQDWRQGIIKGLQSGGLEAVMPNPDMVVGYEGLVV